MNMSDRFDNLSAEDRREAMEIQDDDGATDAAFARVGLWILVGLGYTGLVFWLGRYSVG